METKNQNTEDIATVTPTIPLCGLIMPISPIDGCDALHWNAVNRILSEAIVSAGYKARMVSESDGSGIIQKNIVQNLYYDPIVVCDVSGKNPNVMFELGLRLAFDKPTVIVKDDKTDYSFDTSPIEHIPYPRDLSYYEILDFKDKLKRKILATIKEQEENKEYSVFLQHFGKFKIAKIQDKEASVNEILLSKMDEVLASVNQTSRYKIIAPPKGGDEFYKHRVVKGIAGFCAENGIQEGYVTVSDTDVVKKLYDYLIKTDSELRELASYSKARFEKLVDSELLPF